MSRFTTFLLSQLILSGDQIFTCGHLRLTLTISSHSAAVLLQGNLQKFQTTLSSYLCVD